MKVTDLSRYDNRWYNPGRGFLIRMLWYWTNICFFKAGWNVSSKIKIFILRRFGAEIGEGVVIKPCVNIKYPWRLNVGDNVWIGEGVWIDNLVEVSIGDDVCISQGAMLLCGNHDYKLSTFDLIVGKIKIEDGAWIGAKSIVCPSVTMKSHAVLSVNSVASHDLEAYSIYRGNPAVKIKDRKLID